MHRNTTFRIICIVNFLVFFILSIIYIDDIYLYSTFSLFSTLPIGLFMIFAYPEIGKVRLFAILLCVLNLFVFFAERNSRVGGFSIVLIAIMLIIFSQGLVLKYHEDFRRRFVIVFVVFLLITLLRGTNIYYIVFYLIRDSAPLFPDGVNPDHVYMFYILFVPFTFFFFQFLLLDSIYRERKEWLSW